MDLPDVLCLEDVVWVACSPTGIPSYDFSFTPIFATRRWFGQPERIVAIGRFGARPYDTVHAELQSVGVSLVHSPEQHFACADLRGWYSQIEDLTPRSVVLEKRSRESLAEAADLLGWPIFVKGARQTNRHRASTAIAKDEWDLDRIVAEIGEDPVLGWQTLVCREFVALRHVQNWQTDRIAASFEFRAFFWKQRLVGFGRYWLDASEYEATNREQEGALAVAQAAVDRIDAVFVVVDVAQTADGRWIVIECNDGQESGYAGCSPIEVWRNITKM